jgi:basic membrane protein A
MSRQEAVSQYNQALRLGRKRYKDYVVHGRYPYPQVLDEILDEAMTAGQADLGLVEIPSERIIGTKTKGRRAAFSAGFLPLMDNGTEFAAKWIDLCEAHLSDEGIRDPIQCFEYLGRFYVQEGNKRVSVLRSYEAPSILGNVTRIIPAWSGDPGIQAYYDFMHAYEQTKLYQVCFSQTGRFAKLQAALGFEPDYVWTEEDRRKFLSNFTGFRKAFEKLGGGDLPVTAADALLVWLRVYGCEAFETMLPKDLSRSLEKVWPDVKVQSQPDPISVSTETEDPSAPGFIGRILSSIFPNHLNIAFINDLRPEESDWVRDHDLGRQYLEAVMGGQVDVQVFSGVASGETAEAAMEKAVENGAEVIFATTPTLIAACRKTAAQYPDVKILNCSVSMPYTGVRTYYSRIYEGKFITGAIAGAMSRDGRIGYIASSPIFGVPAGINAFALGAQLTNPRARIQLHWSCAEEDPMGALLRDGVEVISNRDVPTPDRVREPWGLCRVNAGGVLQPLASPYWHWGNFYVKLVQSMFNGDWEALGSSGEGRAVNYWWGMRSRVVDVMMNQDLPAGVRQLVEIIRRGVRDGSILPFHRPIRAQDGTEQSDGSRWFTPEEILRMDWLCDLVDGAIPGFAELLPMARSIVRLQGVYRDNIPPEKESRILL